MSWLGWHFLPTRKELRYGDGRKPRKGDTLTEPLLNGSPSGCTRPVLCSFGFHAARKVLSALYYARGPYVARVKLSGKIIQGRGKAVGMKRTYLSDYVNVTKELRLFATWCARRHTRKKRTTYSKEDPRSAAFYAADDAHMAAGYMSREIAAQERKLTALARAAIRRHEERKKKRGG